MRKFLFWICLFCLVLSACTTPGTPPAPTPSSTAALSPTPLSTSTPVIPVSATVPLKPTMALTPVVIGTTSTKIPLIIQSFMPIGKPVSEFQGIPVMPNAIAGQEKYLRDVGLYSFTVRGSLGIIQTFYMEQLPRLNWRFVSERDGNAGDRIFEFQKGVEEVNISVMVIDETERIVLVMIIK